MPEVIKVEAPRRYFTSLCTFVGRRDNNEDDLFCDGYYNVADEFCGTKLFSASVFDIKPKGNHVFAVCDGMGGMEHGEVASAAAVKCLSDFHAKSKHSQEPFNRDSLFCFYKKTNDVVSNIVAEDGLNDMGTTIAMACTSDDKIFLSNVGDTKVFYYHNGELQRITEDDNVAYDLYREGRINAMQLRTHPQKSALLQYIGMKKSYAALAPHIYEPFTLEQGDVVIICSDGVTDGLDEETICRIICDYSEQCSEIPLAQSIVEKAYEAGSNDNITAVVLQYS